MSKVGSISGVQKVSDAIKFMVELSNYHLLL